nr:hypothetical protein HK105_000232 [Polyrhizophydium stewartii]
MSRAGQVKQAYYKKSESLEKEPKEAPPGSGGGTSQKYVKLSKEVALADQTYRASINYLEEARNKLHTVRAKALMEGERIERKRILTTKNVLTRYCETESNLCATWVKANADSAGGLDAASSGEQEMDSLRVYVECIKEEVDTSLHRQEFQRAWPEPDHVYYENFKTRLPAKNLIFGVPLETVVKSYPDTGVPLVLARCLEAVEARGLDREGLYRISGKVTETNELRVLLETDANAVNLMDEQHDINAIASLVKQFFRELPQPVFYFPARDRAEYSQIADERERLIRLRARVRALPHPNRMLLKRLIKHLSK